ncbi:MAG TPA: PIG-L family deacetylase [candidate division Zixibacteria bacterium]|nr:PIG-L family deacetylase [candidate division Zixibacteria bacterium]
MKRLVAIFAHPDDEGLIAGSLAHHADAGVQVTLICTTKGEAGEISDDTLASPENLGSVREAELRCSCDVIGISDLHLLGYCDSGMDGTPDNERTTAFIQADPDEVKFKLVKLLRSIRPHVVITFEPKGWYGHPDHIAAGRYASEAYRLSSDPKAYPLAGPSWRPDRLFHAVLMRSDFKSIADYVRAQGWDSSDFDFVLLDEPDPLEAQITHVFDADSYGDIKERSMLCHKTQFGEDHIYKKLPQELWRKVNAREYFIQVDPAPDQDIKQNGDLLAGIAE